MNCRLFLGKCWTVPEFVTFRTKSSHHAPIFWGQYIQYAASKAPLLPAAAINNALENFAAAAVVQSEVTQPGVCAV